MSRAILLAILLHVLSPAVFAQDAATRPALTERGCAIIADVALVARALAVEGGERAFAERVVTRTYAGFSDGGGPFDSLRDDIVDLAYRATEPEDALAARVLQTCMRSGGSLDAILGTRL